MRPLLALCLLLLGLPPLAASAGGDCRDARPEPERGATRATPRAVQAQDQWTLGRRFDRVLVVVLENKDYAQVAADPYFAGLAARGALLTHYTATHHPSYPNYLALVAGRSFGVDGNDQVDLPRDAASIADLLEARGLSWAQYAEGYPGGCAVQASAARGQYQRKHVPFMSFRGITGEPQRCARVQPGDRIDFSALPNFAIYTPSMCHDGHDLCARGGDRLAQSAFWLRGFLEPLLANRAAMRGTLVVVTFDEAARRDRNHVYAVLLGDMIAPGTRVDRCYDHYNLLRTIEDNFGLGTLGGEDARSAPIAEPFEARLTSSSPR